MGLYCSATKTCLTKSYMFDNLDILFLKNIFLRMLNFRLGVPVDCKSTSFSRYLISWGKYRKRETLWSGQFYSKAVIAVCIDSAAKPHNLVFPFFATFNM